MYTTDLRRSEILVAAMVAMAAVAAPTAAAEETTLDPAVAELTVPKSSLELGIGNVSSASYKFGEYNGLEKQGVFGVGSLDLLGGGRYDSDDATRWRLKGTDLGLATRSVLAEYGSQGTYRVTVSYDGLRRNQSDSYSTPYSGAGTTVQSLASGWTVPLVPRVSSSAANARGLSSAVSASSALVSGVLVAPTLLQLATSAALQAADLPLFNGYDLSTERERYELALAYQATPKWTFTASTRRENKQGAKPMGTVTRTTAGDISAILADPIDQTTDQFNLAAAYRHQGNFLQAVYYGSKFDNHVAALTWSNWAAPGTSMTMSSAPSNQAHQFSLTAGHEFSKNTRVVANAAYTRNTQNEAFLTDTSTVLVPVASLNGEVITKTWGLKLTSRPQRALNLSLGYKFDERRNRTPVNVYAFYDANEAAGGANINAAFSTALGTAVGLLASNANVNANRPFSRQLNQFTAEADYHLTAAQAVKATLDWQRIERWCDGSWIACVDADKVRELKSGLEWRASYLDSRLNSRLAYTHGLRKVGPYNEDAFLALVPMANVSPSTATGGMSAYAYMLANQLTGYGPAAGYTLNTGNANLFFPLNNALANASYSNQNRISELSGMRRYNLADRQRDRVRWTTDWQPVETLGLQASVDFNKDGYTKSRYGLVSARDWSANVEGSWTPSELLNATLFYTHGDQRAHSAGNTYTANSATSSVSGFTAISGGCFATLALRNASNKIDPCLDWATDMRDKVEALGLTLERRQLWAGKLTLGGELTYTQARTDNAVSGGNYANNPLAVSGAAVGTIAAFYLPASALPTVKSAAVELRLNALYALNAASTVRLAWIYGNFKSTDYAYDGMQLGGLSGVLPSLESAPRYVVNVVVVSYAHRF